MPVLVVVVIVTIIQKAYLICASGSDKYKRKKKKKRNTRVFAIFVECLYFCVDWMHFFHHRFSFNVVHVYNRIELKWQKLLLIKRFFFRAKRSNGESELKGFPSGGILIPVHFVQIWFNHWFHKHFILNHFVLLFFLFEIALVVAQF